MSEDGRFFANRVTEILQFFLLQTRNKNGVGKYNVKTDLLFIGKAVTLKPVIPSLALFF